MRLNAFKAVVFDFDGTLAVLNIDFSSMRKGILGLMKEYAIPEDSIRQTYLLEIIDEAYRGLLQKAPDGAEQFCLRAHRFLEAFEIASAEEGSLIPGVREMLSILRVKGLRLGIVTRNCEKAVRRVFPEIDDFCDVFVPRNLIQTVKPHPDHLALVMKTLGFSGTQCLMVGDHPIDIEAGKRAGMKTAGVLTGRTGREEFERSGADFVLAAATEVYALLEM
jgi:phosphoglycolate phosphatase